MYLSIDDIANFVNFHLKKDSQQSIKISGIPDAAFFPHYNSPFLSAGKTSIHLRPGGPRYQEFDGLWFPEEYDRIVKKNIYGEKMKNVFQFMGIGKPLLIDSGPPSEYSSLLKEDSISRCIDKSQNISNPSLCMFPQFLLRYISSPLFILQPLYDSWVIPHVLGVPLASRNGLNEIDNQAINEFGSFIKQTLFESLPPHATHGLYLESCYHHTFASSNWKYYNSIVDENKVTVPMAIYHWYEVKKRNQRLIYSQNQIYPCENCCGLNPTLANLKLRTSMEQNETSNPLYLIVMLCLIVVVVVVARRFRLLR